MTLDLAKLRAETQALLDGTTPGPWEKVTQTGDWGLVGAHFIQPPNCQSSAVAVVEFVTPYPLGSSRKDRDSTRQADANARLIAAAPTLAADNLRLVDEIERLRDALERIESASRHWADYEAAPDAVHYAHESTARLARAALAEGGKDG